MPPLRGLVDFCFMFFQSYLLQSCTPSGFADDGFILQSRRDGMVGMIIKYHRECQPRRGDMMPVIFLSMIYKQPIIQSIQTKIFRRILFQIFLKILYILP